MRSSDQVPQGRAGYDDLTGSYHVYHDWDGDETVCETVLRSVAAVRNLEICELESMHRRVDTDALDAVFRPQRGRHRRDTGYVAFELSGCAVVVHATGHVEIFDPDRSGPVTLRR